MKLFIIAEYDARLLANRLRAALAIRAYALEVGARVVDISWLEGTMLGRVLERLVRSKKHWALNVWKMLPPSEPRTAAAPAVSWFYGWMFENPVGLATYRAPLLKTLALPHDRKVHVEKILAAQNTKHRIGVHYRTALFPGFANGEFLVSRERMLEMARHYAYERGWSDGTYACIEVTDAAPYADNKEGLHVLAGCEAVVDDNSTYGNLAAWMGDVPHVVVTSGDVDWLYYRGKTSFFDNQYATYAR